MADCPACEAARQGHDTSGLVHRCEGSGTFRAAEAHVAGGVEEIAESWPRWRVTLNFQMRAADEPSVRHRLTGLVSDLLSDDLVEQADFALQEWEVRADAG